VEAEVVKDADELTVQPQLSTAVSSRPPRNPRDKPVSRSSIPAELDLPLPIPPANDGFPPRSSELRPFNKTPSTGGIADLLRQSGDHVATQSLRSSADSDLLFHSTGLSLSRRIDVYQAAARQHVIANEESIRNSLVAEAERVFRQSVLRYDILLQRTAQRGLLGTM